MKTLFYLTSVVLLLVITGCKKNEPTIVKPVVTRSTSAAGYINGVFITNEGTYGNGTGTISFYSKDSAVVLNDIFYRKNGFVLGNVVQSIELYNGKGYIVVNNAGKVETVNASDFASTGSISGLIQPRYFVGISSGKGYISEWGAGGTAGAVKVVDLNTNSIIRTIPTGKGANKMLRVGNSIYVACNGGFDTDSVVNVIDINSDVVVNTITVGANPSDINIDANGNIWVLCIGKWNSNYTALDKPGALVKINPSANAVSLSLPFPNLYSQPSCLAVNSNKTKLYYINNAAIFSHDINSTALSSTAYINRSFYGLGIDPVNNNFYCADPGDYQSNGKVLRYSSTGAVIDSFSVGIIPGSFFFK